MLRSLHIALTQLVDTLCVYYDSEKLSVRMVVDGSVTEKKRASAQIMLDVIRLISMVARPRWASHTLAMTPVVF